MTKVCEWKKEKRNCNNDEELAAIQKVIKMVH
jgi:hypothetical protein